MIDLLTFLLPPPVKSSNRLFYGSFLSLFCHKLTDPHFPIVSSIFFLGSEVLFSERGMLISRKHLSFFSFAAISRDKVPLYGLLLLAEAACSDLPHFVPQLLTIFLSFALVAATIDDVRVYCLDFFPTQEGVEIFKLLGSEVVTHYFYLAYGYLRQLHAFCIFEETAKGLPLQIALLGVLQKDRCHVEPGHILCTEICTLHTNFAQICLFQ